MRQIEKIEIVLENCESIELESKYLGELVIENIRDSVRRIASNSIAYLKSSNKVGIEIFRDANEKEYKPFGIAEPEKIFDRLTKHKDITQLVLIYKNGQSDVIYVDWGDEEYVNEYQQTYRNEFGNLYITIGEHINIEDVFDKEEMEDIEFCKRRHSFILELENKMEELVEKTEKTEQKDTTSP